MSPGWSAPTTGAGRFPRVSGDEPLTPEMETYHLTFSPRERG